jgi:mannose-6-phosphate isomerase-like protein (cupin superfamily)
MKGRAMLYVFGRNDAAPDDTPAVFRGRAPGFSARRLLGKSTQTTHIGWSLCDLESGGHVPVHLHAYEEAFFILEGTATVLYEGREYDVATGDYGVFPLGTPHGWRNRGGAVARWLEIQTPSRWDESADTIIPREQPAPSAPRKLSITTPLSRHIGHFDGSLFLPIATPNSGRRKNLFRQPLSGELIGAEFGHTVMIHLEPGGYAALHDHPHEESYFMMKGEVQLTLADETRIIRPGEYGWAGVGTIHEFRNISNEPAEWIETQSPMPIPAHFSRYLTEWREARAAEMEG